MKPSGRAGFGSRFLVPSHTWKGEEREEEVEEEEEEEEEKELMMCHNIDEMLMIGKVNQNRNLHRHKDGNSPLNCHRSR